MKTFEAQGSLPRLPVPSLEETGARLLGSVRALAAPASLMSEFEALLSDFTKANGHGQLLQRRLEQRQMDLKNTETSWLEDWWLTLAYLSWRTTVLVHSNWYILVQPHPLMPKGNQSDDSFQAVRAAGFVSSFLDFKDSLDSYAFFFVNMLCASAYLSHTVDSKGNFGARNDQGRATLHAAVQASLWNYACSGPWL
jgi:carnitine O-acetyltransferase